MASQLTLLYDQQRQMLRLREDFNVLCPGHGEVVWDAPAKLDEYIAEKVQQGLRILTVEWTHAAAVERLPFHHRDPFDRLLAAQARMEQMRVLSDDAIFDQYGVARLW